MSTTKTGFTKIPDELMDSVAWRTAPLGVRCVVLAIWRRHDGRNNGKIRYGRRHAQADLGCGATQACRYLAEAQKRGFIVGIKRGSFDRKSGAHAARATTWRVTMERWKGGDPTNDWANWTRPENFTNGSRSETTTGPGARPNGANGSRSETRLGRQTGPGARPLIKTKSSYHDEVVASAHDGEFAPLAVGAGPQARARPLCPSELGRSDLQAAWLRSWLASGRLSPDEFSL